MTPATAIPVSGSPTPGIYPIGYKCEASYSCSVASTAARYHSRRLESGPQSLFVFQRRHVPAASKGSPVLLVPALSILGPKAEPVRLQGAGPISMDVARHLMSKTSSMYRVPIDPVSNESLNSVHDSYRITHTMRTVLATKDE